MSINPADIAAFLIQSATHIVIAIVIWIMARLLIHYAVALTGKGLLARRIDPTIIRYARSSLNLLLNVVLLITSLGPGGTVITLSIYCSNTHYWQVFHDGYRIIREAFTQASLPIL